MIKNELSTTFYMNFKTNVSRLLFSKRAKALSPIEVKLVISGLLLIVFSFFSIPAIAQQANEAQLLYQSMCASCHGSDLRGSGLGPDLLDEDRLHGREREDLYQVIIDGIPDSEMPGFGVALSEQQITEIIDYIENVQTNPDLVSAAVPDTLGTLDYAIDVEIFADSLEIPWAIDFLDVNAALITERPGRLRIVENGKLLAEPVAGTPDVLVGEHEWNQGGLLDVTVDPNYEENGWIYLAYSHLQPESAVRDTITGMTRIVRGRLHENSWTDEQVLYEATQDMYTSTYWHYGSRIVFDPEGYLYFSVGDRGAMEEAQDLSRPNGKIHRLHPDGSIPEDNPFVERDGALPSIFSFGHRNPQGMAVHPVTGEVWAVEHGPRGGDELNRLEAGRNYGWPVITYGIDYDGSVLTPHRRRSGMEQPVRYWRPSIAVSGLGFYNGDMFSTWSNKLLVGALAYEEVRLLDIEDGRVIHEEIILKDVGRVREAITGPDGAVYVVLNEPGRVLRLTSREERLQ